MTKIINLYICVFIFCSSFKKEKKKKNHTDDVDVKELTNMTQLNLNTGYYVVLGCYKGKEVIYRCVCN